VIGHDVAAAGEPFIAEGAYAVLGDNLPVEQFSHLSIGAKFTVSPGVLRIVNTPHAKLAPTLLFGNCLPATAGHGAMDRA